MKIETEWIAYGSKRETLVEYVERMLRAIRDHDGDYEAQHAYEDEMYRELVRVISRGMVNLPDAQEACGLALDAQGMDFPRCCK